MNSRVAVVIAVILAALAGFGAASLRRAPPPPPPPTIVPTLVPPLHDAKVGEWLRIKSGVDEQLYRVVGVSPDDYEIDVELTQYQNGLPLAKPTPFKWHRNSFGLPHDCVVRAIDRDRVEVDGKSYECWRLQVFTHQGNWVYWISEEIPAHGVLMMTKVGKNGPDMIRAARAVDWGFDEK